MRNLQMMRQFYRIFPNANALRSELSVVGSDPNVVENFLRKIEAITTKDYGLSKR